MTIRSTTKSWTIWRNALEVLYVYLAYSEENIWRNISQEAQTHDCQPLSINVEDETPIIANHKPNRKAAQLTILKINYILMITNHKAEEER